MLLIFQELAYIHEPVGVCLFPDLVTDVVFKDSCKGHAGRPRVAAQSIEQRVLEFTRVLVVGDESDGSPALHVASMELARINRATACCEGSLTTHLPKLPLPTVDVRLVWPFKGAFTMVQTIEELSDVSGLHGPLQHTVTLKHVVLEGALVAAHTEVVCPAKHALAVHHLILELADVAPPVGPLEHAVLVNAVVQQSTCVHASIRPLLCALAGRSMVFEDSCDPGAVGEPVTAGSHNFAVVPKPFKFGTVRPVESTAALELAVMELPLEPRAVWQGLLALAFYAVVLEVSFVTGAISPGQLALALSDAILPLAIVLDAIWPLHLSTTIHAILEPLAAVHPALLCTFESALALLHPMLEVAGIAIAIWPSASSLAMEDALLQAADVLLSRRPGHLAVAPHLVLAPLAIVGAAGGPGLLPAAPHVALMELTEILAAVAPNVVALAMHSAVEPGANVGVAVGEDSLILDNSVGRQLVTIWLPRCHHAVIEA
mmetsp:Transcript_76734/g.183833  ORF Transcript_76734/g.183833 Transcript_76734/m.183833 type:complete len:488 (-) Transcript_76734:188-1651(-)